MIFAETMLARGYVEGIPGAQDLLDMLAYNEIEALNAAEKKDFKYEEHLSKAQINLGIKSGLLLQGTINISTHNYLEVKSHFSSINDGLCGREQCMPK